ncbi:MAG: lipid droplet-associated protein [Gordonia sp. (in: high G+C Gram-positive bacteria)]
MVRAPYPARIAAGLIVTAIEETRKLPTLLITLPMTAISQTLQAGMRAQQGIAELAIKGDAALEALFDRPDEQPEWARFDEDEIEPGVATPVVPITSLRPHADAITPPTPESRGRPGPSATARDAASSEATAEATGPRPDAGRFALYSSAPDTVIAAAGRPAAGSAGEVDAPGIVGRLGYDTLTLAQLRAKLQSVGAEELGELRAYEQENRNRAPFVTMLDNRITAAEAKRSN